MKRWKDAKEFRERLWKGSGFKDHPLWNVNDFWEPRAGQVEVSYSLSSGQSDGRADIFQLPFPAQQDKRDGWESASSILTFLRKMLNRCADIEGSRQHLASRRQLTKSLIRSHQYKYRRLLPAQCMPPFQKPNAGTHLHLSLSSPRQWVQMVITTTADPSGVFGFRDSGNQLSYTGTHFSYISAQFCFVFK